MLVGALCGALVAVALPSASASVTAGRPGGGAGPEIRRTEYGIPHILAHNYSDLGYGYGYAFAQDNACEMADRALTLRGERSRYLGPAAATNDALGGPVANLDSDAYFQAQRRAGTVRRLLARPAPLGPTPELRQLVDGYAAGFDRYLKDVGVANLPDPTCQGQPWVQPITADDVWANVLDIDQAASSAGLRGEIATAGPPTTPATPITSATPSAAPRGASSARPAASAEADATRPGSLSAALAALHSADRGSNGWALGADATVGHDGMVLANPHLPWNADARLYQVQLTIPGVLDVSGAGLYGTPVVEIGHTAGVAWTHTTTDSDHFSLYRLRLVPGDPTSYLVDGRAERMRRQQVPVEVLGADGALSTVTRTFYSSRYGPVLADGWTGATAIALRDADADNIRSMDQWLAMDRAQNIGELRAAQRRYQGSPWVYTMAADTEGAAYFTDSSATPHLTDAQLAACTLPPVPDLPPLLDGATTSCDWGSDADAVEPGLYGPGADPTLLRHDYVADSNNDPVLVNPAAPLAGYPKVFGTGLRLDLRPQNGLSMIGGRLSGTDGLGPAGFSLTTLRQLMSGDSDRSAQIGLADVLTMCRAHPTLTASDGTAVDVRAACEVLGRWDGRGGVDSHGQVLWGGFFRHLGNDFPETWWRVPFDPKQPLTTPRGINGEDTNVQTAFADVVRATLKEGGALDTAPGEAMRWDGVPLHGCSGEEGCFDVVFASPTSGQNGGVDSSRTNIAAGSSFLMAVELTPAGPRTSTMLTYSESANPTSPHYADQTVLFSHSQWVSERFSAADIAASPALRVTPLRR